MRALLAFICILFMTSSVYSQELTNTENQKNVYIIGEDGGKYESMVASCPDMLLTVAGNSMDEAFMLWTDMLIEMQKFSEETSFDLSGVKVWINTFWNEDGSINAIVYYPKPTSRNMDFEELTDFFNLFAQNYVLPKEHAKCFSHYGSASFPVYVRNEQAGGE